MVFIIVDNQMRKKGRYDTETINCKSKKEAVEIFDHKWQQLSEDDQKRRDEFYLTNENGAVIADVWRVYNE
jgi:hypothetical protein